MDGEYWLLEPEELQLPEKGRKQLQFTGKEEYLYKRKQEFSRAIACEL